MPLDLIGHIQQEIQRSPAARPDFTKIFSDLLSTPQTHTETEALLNQNAHFIKDELKKLHFLGTVDALEKLGELADKVVNPLQRSGPLQDFLARTYRDEETGLLVQRQILAAFLSACVNQLPPEESALGEALLSTFESQGRPQKERRDLIRDKLPKPKVAPTVCYYSGKMGLNMMGHVALKIPTTQVPHSVVVCNEPVPYLESNPRKMREYFERLPIDPHHNAFLVAHQGYNYSLTLLNVPEDENEKIADYLKPIVTQNPKAPVLVRKGERIFLSYIPKPPAKERRIESEDLTGTLEGRALIALHDKHFKKSSDASSSVPFSLEQQFNQMLVTLKVGDPKLLDPGVLYSMGVFISIPKQIWYLSRKDESERKGDRDIFEYKLIEDSYYFETFKDEYVKKLFTEKLIKEYLAEKRLETFITEKLVEKQLAEEKTAGIDNRTVEHIGELREKILERLADEKALGVADLPPGEVEELRQKALKQVANEKVPEVDALSPDQVAGLRQKALKQLAEEKASCVTDLSPEQVEELQQTPFQATIPACAAYLSYGSEPGSIFKKAKDAVLGVKNASDAGIGHDEQALTEKIVYTPKGEEPYYLELPPVDWEDYERAKSSFALKSRGEYSLLTYNCATAVQIFMKDVGLLAEPEDLKILPSGCAITACKLIMEDIEKSRQKVFADPELRSADKVRRLLELEMRRLNIQLEEDKIKHIAAQSDPKKKTRTLFKDGGVKQEKIKILRDELLAHIPEGGSLTSENRKAMEGVIARMLEKDRHSKTAKHLQECLDQCFPPVPKPVAEVKTPAMPVIEEVKGEVSILAPPSMLDQRRPSETQANYPPPETWVTIEKSQGQYRYGSDEREARKILKEVMDVAAPPPAISAAPLANAPPLQGTQVRLSTQTLYETDGTPTSRFGLLEKCVKPGEVRSELLPPPQSTPNIDQWLLMIDRQFEEGCKALGKRGKVITIHTIDFDELERQVQQRRNNHPPSKQLPDLKDFEKAYIQYCLAMDLNCRVVKADGTEVSLSVILMKKIVPPIVPGELRAKIVDARDNQPFVMHFHHSI